MTAGNVKPNSKFVGVYCTCCGMIGVVANKHGGQQYVRCPYCGASEEEHPEQFAKNETDLPGTNFLVVWDTDPVYPLVGLPIKQVLEFGSFEDASKFVEVIEESRHAKIVRVLTEL